MKTRIGINGFGRIGRNTFRILMERFADSVEVVAINDLTDAETLAHLLKYDSLYGSFPGKVETDGENLVVNGLRIPVLKEHNPELLPWTDLGVAVVLESTGRFTKREQAQAHITAGARTVLISAPATGADLTIVLGVNDDVLGVDNGGLRVSNDGLLAQRKTILSNASCTTNCLAPVATVLEENFGIRKGMMTTVHAYTNDQNILDLPHKDLRRARAAGLSIIPTKTGAATAIGLVIPALDGKLGGFAYRVPTPVVSILDLTVETEKPVTLESVHQAFREAAQGRMKGILDVSDEPLVSIDYRGNPHSAVIDMLSTTIIGENLLKVAIWYDNEWGFSNRCVELLARL